MESIRVMKSIQEGRSLYRREGVMESIQEASREW